MIHFQYQTLLLFLIDDLQRLKLRLVEFEKKEMKRLEVLLRKVLLLFFFIYANHGALEAVIVH